MKNATKRGSAILAALVLVVSTVLGQTPLESRAETDTSASTYTEYTFSDFGIRDGKHIAPIGGTVTNLKSLDKVAIKGKIAIAKPDVYLRIGGMPGNNYYSIVSLRSNGAGTKLLAEDYHTGGNVQGVTVCDMKWGEEINLKITFNYVNEEADVLVKFYVDGKFAAEYTSVGTAATVRPTIQISDATYNKYIVINQKYTELTFSDFGLIGGDQVANTEGKADIADLDKVAISGKVTFSDRGKYLRIGIKKGDNSNGIVALRLTSAGNVLEMANAYDYEASKDGYIFNEIMDNKPFDLRVTFDYAGEDILVKVYVNNKKAREYTHTGTASEVLPIVKFTDGDISIESYPKEDKTYRTLTFSNWGIVNDEYVSETVYALQDNSITSLDGCAFEGVVNFGGVNNNYISIGGESTPSNSNAISLQQNENQFIIMNYLNKEGESYVDGYNRNGVSTYNPTGWNNSGYMKLRLTYDKIMTDTWVIGVWVNGEHQGDRYLKNTALGTALYLFSDNTADSTVNSMKIGYIDESDIFIDWDKDQYYPVTEEGTTIDGNIFQKDTTYRGFGVHTVSYTQYTLPVNRDLIFYKPGDATLDENIDLDDVVRVILYIGGEETANKAQRKSSDLNSNNFLDTEDVQLLRKEIIGSK